MPTRAPATAASVTTPAAEAPAALSDRLSMSSAPYTDPLDRIPWPELSTENFWLPESAVSLHGLDIYHRLPEAQRRHLSQLEYLNAVEAGIWLEAIFMARIADSVQTADDDGALRYHLHELREEAGHSLMFMEFYRRTGMRRVPTAFPGLRLANLVGRRAPFESTAFWLAVFIGEQVPDRLNRVVHHRRREVDPVAHAIARIHTRDEARHIAHAREQLQKRLGTMPRWRRRLLGVPIRRLFGQFVRALYLPEPALYERAGLTPGRDWARRAATNPERVAFIDTCVAPTRETLAPFDLHLDWR
ncbi:MAG: diiron oxygenase [Pseudomonadota bacterium]